MANAEAYLPTWIEKLLLAALPTAQQDEVLGDLSERYALVVAERGLATAKYWLYSQVLAGLPAFYLFSLQSESRRQTVNGNILQSRTSTALSALLLIPAMLIVIPGLLFSLFGKAVEASLNSVPGLARFIAWVDQPWIVLGGLGLALVINIVAVARFKFSSDTQNISATISLKKSAWNLILLILSVVLAAALIAYLIGENILPLL